MNTKLIVVVAVAALVAVFGFDREKQWRLAEEHAKQLVCKSMQAPSTAKFEDVRVFRGTENTWCVTGIVSAFVRGGEHSRKRFTVVLDHVNRDKPCSGDVSFYPFGVNRLEHIPWGA